MHSRTGPVPDDQVAERAAPSADVAHARSLVPSLLNRPVADGGEALMPERLDQPVAVIGGPLEHREWGRLRHPFFLLVVLPMALLVGFEYLVAADQYVSEASFIVRAPQGVSPAGGLSQMLGLSTGPVPADAHSVGEYLLSHDAVDAIGRQPLITIFRRPEADVATRLRFATPQPETLLKYYRGKVEVATSSETGITALRVRAFRPDDARQLATKLLQLGESRVNGLNQRLLEDGLRTADRQVREAEAAAQTTQVQMTAFRQGRRDVDPERTGAAQIDLTTTLQQQAAQARANFESMAASIPSSAPQYRVMEQQVRGLERQVEVAKARLSGSTRSVAGGLGAYEGLRLRQQFAAKQYEAAAASYQSAREQLLKQQLFIVPVVRPNMPGKALYPRRLEIIATALFGLLMAYAIGWLALAGAREHRA